MQKIVSVENLAKDEANFLCTISVKVQYDDCDSHCLECYLNYGMKRKVMFNLEVEGSVLKICDECYKRYETMYISTLKEVANKYSLFFI